MQGLGSSKAPDAFRTISEVAEDLDIPQHVLRFWETKFTAIRPLKRAGGRRYYRPDDVDLLKGIRLLLYGKGYTIKGVQRILKEDGPRVIQQVGRDGAETLARPAPQPFEDSDDTPEWRDAPTASFRPPAEPERPAFAEMPEQVFDVPGIAARSTHPRPLPIDQLRAVLADLYECRRILDATKAS